MKPVRKMVVANLAIMIDKDDPKQCGYGTKKICRFIDAFEGVCILFAKPLKAAKTEDPFFLRCKPCLEAEPIK